MIAVLPGCGGRQRPIGSATASAAAADAAEHAAQDLVGHARTGRAHRRLRDRFDRTLAALPGAKAIGIAYAGQEMPEVPAGPQDFRLPLIATEAGVIVCGDPV